MTLPDHRQQQTIRNRSPDRYLICPAKPKPANLRSKTHKKHGVTLCHRLSHHQRHQTLRRASHPPLPSPLLVPVLQVVRLPANWPMLVALSLCMRKAGVPVVVWQVAASGTKRLTLVPAGWSGKPNRQPITCRFRIGSPSRKLPDTCTSGNPLLRTSSGKHNLTVNATWVTIGLAR